MGSRFAPTDSMAWDVNLLQRTIANGYSSDGGLHCRHCQVTSPD